MQVKDKIDLDSGDLRCPRCFGKDLAPSQPRGVRDWLMSRLGKVPRHCRFCEKRFYVEQEALRAIQRSLAQARHAAWEEISRQRPQAPPRPRLPLKSAAPAPPAGEAVATPIAPSNAPPQS